MSIRTIYSFKLLPLIGILVSIFSDASSQTSKLQPSYLPSGWRLTSHLDIISEGGYGWSWFVVNKGKLPYYATADFDKNGELDVAAVLHNDATNEYGLFVFLSYNDQHFEKLRILGCKSCDINSPQNLRKYIMTGHLNDFLFEVRVANSVYPMILVSKFEVGVGTFYVYDKASGRFKIIS